MAIAVTALRDITDRRAPHRRPVPDWFGSAWPERARPSVLAFRRSGGPLDGAGRTVARRRARNSPRWSTPAGRTREQDACTNGRCSTAARVPAESGDAQALGRGGACLHPRSRYEVASGSASMGAITQAFHRPTRPARWPPHRSARCGSTPADAQRFRIAGTAVGGAVEVMREPPIQSSSHGTRGVGGLLRRSREQGSLVRNTPQGAKGWPRMARTRPRRLVIASGERTWRDSLKVKRVVPPHTPSRRRA